MNREDVVHRLAEVRGETQKRPKFVEQKHPLPDWLFGKILSNVGGQPGVMLMAWLETHQHTSEDVSRWHAKHYPTKSMEPV